MYKNMSIALLALAMLQSTGLYSSEAPKMVSVAYTPEEKKAVDGALKDLEKLYGEMKVKNGFDKKAFKETIKMYGRLNWSEGAVFYTTLEKAQAFTELDNLKKQPLLKEVIESMDAIFTNNGLSWNYAYATNYAAIARLAVLKQGALLSFYNSIK